MGFVFLILRFIIGGYFTWHGARHLNAYGREPLIDYARSKSVPLPLLAVPLSGLMLIIGGVSMITGLFPAGGVSLLVSFLVPAAFLLHGFWRIDDVVLRAIERRRFVLNVALAIFALALLVIPQSWLLTMGDR